MKKKGEKKETIKLLTCKFYTLTIPLTVLDLCKVLFTENFSDSLFKEII